MTHIEVYKAGTKEVIAEFDLPDSPAEVTLEQFIEFRVTELDESKKHPNNFLIPMTKAVSVFTGVDVEQLAKAAIGDKDAKVTTGDVLPLYKHISESLLTWKPELLTDDGERTIIYNEEEYYLPAVFKKENGEIEHPKLSVYEVVELDELLRLSKIKTDEEYKGEVPASLWFADYRNILAVLLRKKGEQLPLDDVKRDEFIRERARHFANIDFQTAAYVDFFLASTKRGFGNLHGPIGSLTNALLNLQLKTVVMPSIKALPKVDPMRRLPSKELA